MAQQTCECGYTSSINIARHKKTCIASKHLLEIARLREEYQIEIARLREENDKLRAELLKKPKRATIKPQTKTKLILKQRGLCNVCSTQLSDNLWDIDHIVPWADSFNNDEDNLQVLCLPCHRAKTTQERAG
tara:strand:- start:16 stop:411 length:396 start_codon:yes stop_codon:yes gene_type:complete